MSYRLLPFTILLLGACAAWGQTPQSISLQAGGQLGTTSHMACADQFAGTISFANFIGQSNDIDLDTIFLCEGDQINIVHNGDADLTGDPNPFSAPGITYGFFDCPPTVSGDLAAIIADPCLTTTPPPLNNLWVTAGGSFNGNITFSNTGTLQNTFNGGDPVLLWFAPLTIDNFAIKQYEVDPNTGEIGPCTNLNVDEAFAVVYLNEISLSNFQPIANSAGCGGNVTVTGGLPEWDGSFYNVSISLIGNPLVTGTVISNPATHGGTIEFYVPTPGFYTITVEDGKSCGDTFTANMASCISVAQSAQSMTVAPGDNICVNITNESGFDDLVAMQYGITWNPTMLDFTNITNLTTMLPNYAIPCSFNVVNDTLIFSWGSLSGAGITLPDGEVMFQICFDVIGQDGDCTPLDFVTPTGSTIEVVNMNGVVLGFNGIPGEICISNSALVVDLVQASVTCFEGDDGGFTVTVSGGMAPYAIGWQMVGGGTIGGPGIINVDGGSFTANGLEAGLYNVVIADAQGNPLTVTEQVEVLGPPIIEVLFSVNPGPCNGDPGNIVSTLVLDSNQVFNPLANYSYAWSNMASNVTSIFNLNSGFYSLTVTEDATGCTVTNTTFMPQAQPLSVNIVIDSASCSGVSDGNLTLTVAGGTPDPNGNYHIEMPTAGIGIDIQGTGTNVSGLISANYPLTVTDANGCVLQQNIFMPAIKVLATNALVTPINCTNPCSGSIFLNGTTTGGLPGTPYNFDWFGFPPPPPPTNTTATTSTISGLCEGVYWVVMEDITGCEIVDTFFMNEPPPLDVVLVNVEDETCAPGMDGSITVAVTGGSWPFAFSWNNPSTDSTATGLSAGLYTVTVEDAQGCFGTLSETVGAPPPPQILSLPDDILPCINSTSGSLTATASADVISFDWSNADTGPSINGLSPGEYILTVTNGSGCTAVDTAQVTAPAPMVLDSVVLLPPVCPGDGFGTITAFVSGGTPPYNFQWSTGIGGVGVAVLFGPNVTAGMYSATVTDANNCQPPLLINATLTDPPGIVVDFSAIDSVSCANTGMTCDGTATASAQYSDGSAGVFDFFWNLSGEFDNNVTTSTAILLCQGPQEVTVSDGICNVTVEVLIPAPLPISSNNPIVVNVSCDGLSDGSITILPAGGTPPYSIVWAGGQTGATISGLPAGVYTAVITDSKNCTYNHTVTITEPEPLVLSLNFQETLDVSCFGFENGIISVVATGGNVGTGDEIYNWQNGVADPSSSVASGLSAGAYSVTVIDHRGCEASLTHVLSEPPPIFFRVADFEPINCFGESTYITVDSVWGGNPTIYQFDVNLGSDRDIDSLVQVYAGEHVIRVIDLMDTECFADTTITIQEPQAIQLELPEIVEIELGDTSSTFDPVIVSSLPIDSFLWEPADQLSCSDCKNPRIIGIKNQIYTLTVWDLNGCSATAQVLLDIDKNRNVYIPNVYSPNGDGINDKFQVFTGPGVSQVNFVRVYDRWGELVFEEPEDLPPSPDGTPGWNGEFRDRELNPAVFLYLVEVTFIDGRVLLYRGDVALVR